MNEKPATFNLQNEDKWLSVVRQLLRGLRFGVVQIIIQDSKVIQVEKTEKVRLASHES